MMAEFDRVVSDPRLRLGELEAHLAGPASGAPFKDDFIVFATSGTTGVRGVVAYLKQELELWTAAAARAMRRMGVVPTSRLVSIEAPSPLHLSRRLFAGLLVRVVLAPSAPPGTAGRVRNTLARALKLAGAARAHVTVEPVSEITRDRRHAAKLRLVA